MKIFHYPRVDSTNSVALELAESDPDLHGAVVWADQQDSGRGQHGRTFASPAGGLYCSLILRPRLELHRLPLVTLAAGVGCCRALEDLAGVWPRLKWPNDLYLAERKLAGILTETGGVAGGRTTPPVIVGIGVNVNTRVADLPADLQRSTISLLAHTGNRFDLDQLLAAVVSRVKEAVSVLEQDPAILLARWRRRDYLVGRPVELAGSAAAVRGRAMGLAEDGRYRILGTGGREHLVLAGSLRLAGPVTARDSVP